jgi:hypothetical protein
LGAIYVTWPVGTFQDDTRWWLTVRSLAVQIATTYARGLFLRFAIDEDTGAMIELQDADGNSLTMGADSGEQADITLAYVSAAYNRAVNGTRVRVTSY